MSPNFTTRHLRKALLALSCAAAWTAPALAAQDPTPLATDNRIRQVAYDPNQVVEVIGSYGYQSSIEFSSGEEVKLWTLGDSIAWQTVPYKNRLFLKPVEAQATTNLTVITNKRTYYFRLRADKNPDNQTWLVRFHYPEALMINVTAQADDGGVADGLAGAPMAAGRAGERQPVGAAPVTAQPDLQRVNTSYQTSGDRDAIGLARVVDDGQFTYMLFDEESELPAVYLVGPDGTEQLVNTRREGDYLVVERTARQFTLRNGGAYLCVRNEGYKRPRAAAVMPPLPSRTRQQPVATAAAKPAAKAETQVAAASQAAAPAPASAPVQEAPPLKEFALGQQDKTYAGVLGRWGRESGYDVRWESDIEAAVTGDATVRAVDFMGALKQTVAGLQGAGYPVRAMVYADKVVRIVDEQSKEAQ